MFRVMIAVLCALGMLVSGCSVSRGWSGPTVDPLVDGGGVVESGVYRDMPYVMASVNGSEPMKFLFDTGANLNVLFTSSAEELNIKPTGEASVSGASGMTKKLPLAFVDDLVFGPVSMRDMAFLVHDLTDASVLLGPEIDGVNNQEIAGIIGIRGLEEFTIDIDYPEKRVSITHERLSPENPGTSELRVRPDGLLMVPVMFLDPDEPGIFHTVWSLLDSGNVRFFDLHTKEAERFIDHTQRTGGHKATGIHGVERLVDAGPLRGGVLIGMARLDGVFATVSDVENRLSSNTLRSFRVKIDIKSRLVSFTRPDNARRLVSTRRMGITNLWTLNGYRVDQVIEGSAAELLGIRAFDQIVSIDGKSPGKLHLKASYWAVEMDAKTITIGILRQADGARVDVVVPIDGQTEPIERQEPINPS